MKVLCHIGWILVLISGAATGAPETRAEEVSRLMGLLKARTFDERIIGYRALDYSGLTEDAMFEELARRLDMSYLGAGHETERVKELRFLVQALATSGNEKYRAYIEKVASAGRHVDEKARRHAEEMIFLLASYKDWNRIINHPRPGMSWPRARVENLLAAPDANLRKQGLKRIREMRPPEPEAFESVARYLIQMLESDLSDPTQVDVAAWQCKTLAVSRDTRYLPLLQRAAAEPSPKRLRKHAEVAIEMLSEPIEPDKAE